MPGVKFLVNICGRSLGGIDFGKDREKSDRRVFESDWCPFRAASPSMMTLSVR
jgi:hypothetical protein